MPLPDPQLDDRHFQDLVNEAKTLIPRFTPEWTDHNVSDPGVTLIEAEVPPHSAAEGQRAYVMDLLRAIAALPHQEAP